ncbi:uncharacterized protein BCR38DRAFT_414599 [Pseudomassariella vexata]|uniref:Uncharacterized protein n=1 Tax=Pseudomassariella vexata TaxID=1141098 RepID=A0A1Y2D9Z1_9PEZI|nr:uncharacterized protein BCR38DRAFT_414599 [Pseudomassariella vexata]ORY56080.1 hypothetical protein BCR38DRAFT_414599 [Pseudomassariella vexata]
MRREQLVLGGDACKMMDVGVVDVDEFGKREEARFEVGEEGGVMCLGYLVYFAGRRDGDVNKEGMTRSFFLVRLSSAWKEDFVEWIWGVTTCRAGTRCDMRSRTDGKVAENKMTRLVRIKRKCDYKRVMMLRDSARELTMSRVAIKLTRMLIPRSWVQSWIPYSCKEIGAVVLGAGMTMRKLGIVWEDSRQLNNFMLAAVQHLGHTEI